MPFCFATTLLSRRNILSVTPYPQAKDEGSAYKFDKKRGVYLWWIQRKIIRMRYTHITISAKRSVCVLLRMPNGPDPPCRLYPALLLLPPEFSIFPEFTDNSLLQTGTISLKGNRHQERKGPEVLKGMEIWTMRKSAYQPDPFWNHKTGYFRRGATSGRSHFFGPNVLWSDTP